MAKQRGRPRVIEGQVRELLVGLVGMGCSRKQAARHVGVGQRTLFKTLSEDQEFAAQLRRAQMQQDITPLRKILEHSQKSWRAAAWILERQNPNRYARRPPLMVTKADCMSFVKSVLGFLMQGACSEDQQRVAENLQRLDQLLGGQDATTPRGRRVVKEMAAGEENCTATTLTPALSQEERGNFGTAPEANYGTAPRGAGNAENAGPIGENAPSEQGGGI